MPRAATMRMIVCVIVPVVVGVIVNAGRHDREETYLTFRADAYRRYCRAGADQRVLRCGGIRARALAAHASRGNGANGRPSRARGAQGDRLDGTPALGQPARYHDREPGDRRARGVRVFGLARRHPAWRALSGVGSDPARDRGGAGDRHRDLLARRVRRARAEAPGAAAPRGTGTMAFGAPRGVREDRPAIHGDAQLVGERGDADVRPAVGAVRRSGALAR
jgi:hypothetical protein